MYQPQPVLAQSGGRSLAGPLGVLFTLAGLLGHVLAAQAIGGSRLAYRDHLAGFLLILVVTGAVLALLGRRFWPGRRARTLLLIGLVQALFGLFVYVERFSVHG